MRDADASALHQASSVTAAAFGAPSVAARLSAIASEPLLLSDYPVRQRARQRA
jgi:hypothetical protein